MGYDVGRIINNDKVSDHHALLPTKESVKKGFSQLTEKQRNLYCMIGQRLARAVSKNVHMKKHRLRYSVRDMNLWQKESV